MTNPGNIPKERFSDTILIIISIGRRADLHAQPAVFHTFVCSFPGDVFSRPVKVHFQQVIRAYDSAHSTPGTEIVFNNC